MLRITLLSALFVLLIGDAVAADTIRVPDDFATIQEAVDFAGPGDRVLIVSGSYTESVVISTERVTLTGEDDTEIVGIPGGKAVTVLARRVALKNLTITGTPDVAVFVADSESVTIRRCVISGAT